MIVREGMEMTKEKRFDNLYNEGGEGYNPHRPKDADIPRWVVLFGKKDRILRFREGTSLHDSRYAELQLELMNIEKEIEAQGKKV